MKKIQVKRLFANCQRRKKYSGTPFPANLDLTTTIEKNWSLDNYVAAYLLLLHILEEKAVIFTGNGCCYYSFFR